MTRNGTSLLDRLIEHGIPEPTARVYLSACRDGPQTASALARASGLDRVQAYRSIRRLESEGLLRPGRGRPMRFHALPPSDLVDGWIRASSERLRRLEGDRDRLLTEWNDAASRPDAHETQKFATLEGRTTIWTWLKRQIGAARREILLVGGPTTLERAMDGGIDRVLAQAHERGVRIRLVTPIGGASLKDAKHFEPFCELHHTAEALTSRTVVIDRQLCLAYVSGEEGFGPSDAVQVALWSTVPSFVGLAREYHHRLWVRSVPAASRFVELENPPRAELPVGPRYGAESFERIREITELGMRATGVSDLTLDLPEMIETVAGRLGRQIAAATTGATLPEVAESLGEYYRTHALGRLDVAKARPFTLRVSQCFACTEQSPEVGRLLCPKVLQTVLETRLGTPFTVSKPDPRRHADRGCRFVVSAA